MGKSQKVRATRNWQKSRWSQRFFIWSFDKQVKKIDSSMTKSILKMADDADFDLPALFNFATVGNIEIVSVTAVQYVDIIIVHFKK